MIYWHARPSAHLPTVEIRVADAAATVDDAVLFAGLVRALVMTVGATIDAGLPAPRCTDQLTRAACWLAARDGLDGRGIDLRTGGLVPAWDLANQLVEHVKPALERGGDLQVVHDRLRCLRARGSAAARQRAAFHRREEMRDVVDFLSDETVRCVSGRIDTEYPAPILGRT